MAVGNTAQTAAYLYENNRDYNNNKVWEQAFNSNNLNALSQVSGLTKGYDSALQNLSRGVESQNQQVNNSALGQGYKQQIRQQNQQAMMEAYESYRSQLGSNLQEIEKTRQSNEQQISDYINTEATKYNQFTQSVFDYYDYLIDNGLDTSNQLWNKYTYKSGTESSTYTGEQIKSLAYDEDGNLTKFGIDFFDQLQNTGSNMMQFGELGVSSYDTWAKQSKDYSSVYDWAYSPDASGLKTNYQAFREMTGRGANDQAYNFTERSGGLDNEQVTNKLNELGDLSKLGSDTSSITKATKIFDQAKKYKGNQSFGDLAVINNSIKELRNSIKDTMDKSTQSLDTLKQKLDAMGLSDVLSNSQLEIYKNNIKKFESMTKGSFGEWLIGTNTDNIIKSMQNLQSYITEIETEINMRLQGSISK
jgi:hypothetical protein